jgi:hypothetical protein
MAVVRPIRLKKVSYGATPTQIVGAVSISWTSRPKFVTSKSDADIGVTGAVITGWEVTGKLVFLNHKDAAALANLGVTRLVIEYYVAGGGTRTRTIGTTADASGVIFLRPEEISYGEGGREGSQNAIAVPFRGIFKSTYTTLANMMAVA